jgi:hypothetical protein
MVSSVRLSMLLTCQCVPKLRCEEYDAIDSALAVDQTSDPSAICKLIIH